MKFPRVFGQPRSIKTRAQITVLTPCVVSDIELLVQAGRSIANQNGVNAYWNIAIDGVAGAEYERLKRQIKHYPHEYPELSSLKGRIAVSCTGPKNCGAAAARLHASFRVSTPFVTHLDADDIALPNAYARLINECDQNRVWWATGRQMRITGDEEEIGPDLAAFTGRKLQPGELPISMHAVSSPRAATWGAVARTPLLKLAGIQAYGYEDDTAILASYSAFASGVIINEPVYGYTRGRSGQTTSDADDKERERAWRPFIGQDALQRASVLRELGIDLSDFPGPLYQQNMLTSLASPLKQPATRSRPIGF